MPSPHSNSSGVQSVDQVPIRLQENLQLLDHMYPKTKVRTPFHILFSMLCFPGLNTPVFYLNTNVKTIINTNINTNMTTNINTRINTNIKDKYKYKFKYTYTYTYTNSFPYYSYLFHFISFLLFSICLQVDLLLVETEEFSPELVMQLSLDLKIQTSFMFIRCPGENFPYNLGDFRGVRTIMQ